MVNEVIFQDQYCFIMISAENRQNPNLEKLLKYFKVKLLRQNEFELVHTQEEVCLGLKSQLKLIIPYFKIWIENEDSDANHLLDGRICKSMRRHRTIGSFIRIIGII